MNKGHHITPCTCSIKSTKPHNRERNSNPMVLFPIAKEDLTSEYPYMSLWIFRQYGSPNLNIPVWVVLYPLNQIRLTWDIIALYPRKIWLPAPLSTLMSFSILFLHSNFLGSDILQGYSTGCHLWFIHPPLDSWDNLLVYLFTLAISAVQTTFLNHIFHFEHLI